MLVAASIYAFFSIHETKGLRMDQMDELFGYKRPESHYVKELDPEVTDKESGKGSGIRIEVV